MKTILLADPVRYPRMTTEELRATFLLGALCAPGELHLAYIDLDRALVGHAAPIGHPIPLPTYPELRASYFTERRELGVLNIGGAGAVHVGQQSISLDNLDVLYIGRGNAEIHFESKSQSEPAIFYLLSYPAHASHPVTLVKKADANPTTIGSPETCNLRTICQVHPSRRRKKLPAGHGSHPSAQRQRLEHHAAAHPHAPRRRFTCTSTSRPMPASFT